MTEMDRVRIVENIFPNWREHLHHGKVIDDILEGFTCQQIIFNRCSRPGCNYVPRRGRKTRIECATTAAQYMRTCERRKATKQDTGIHNPDYNLDGSVPSQVVM